MKTFRLFLLVTATAIVASVVPAFGALVESVESSRASVAFQKVDAFLSEKAVADQLTALGVSQTEVQARLAQLDDEQLAQLAAEIDLIRAGGTIQGAALNPVGPFNCVIHQLGILFYNVYHLLFCWTDMK